VSPLWPALAATLSAAVALRGLVLMRDRGPVEERLAIEQLATQRRTGPLTRLVDLLAGRLGPGVWRALGGGARGSLSRLLDRAGHPGGLTVEGYVGRWSAFVALGVLGSLLLALADAGLAAGLLLVLAVLGPWIWLSRGARVRQGRLQRDLPDFLDVLSVTVRAGLAYRPALTRVSESLGGPVGDELTTTLRQMDVGASRRDAFLALRERNDSEALASFVTAQLQAQELGVPLADALTDIALEMRRTAHADARKRAQRAAPRVSLIVTTVIVPASILLILMALFLGSDVQGSGILG
jgi:tight adherence protein C